MTDVSRSYVSELTTAVGSGWNRFWFSTADPYPTCLLRIAVGLLAVYFVGSYSTDLVTWFGSAGLLPSAAVRQLSGETFGGTIDAVTRFSYLHYVSTPSGLWICHALGLLVLLCFTLGLYSRITSILSLVIVLSYIHRAPLLAGQFEPLLTMAIFYLCIAPVGAHLSVDRWWQTRRGAASTPARPSVAANISLRLLQIHVVGFYLLMALSQLAGETWWMGDAAWWLIAHSESRLADLTFLHSSPLLVAGLTHGIVLFELLFALLIWKPLARPLLMLASLIVWPFLALLTGLVSFAAIMLVLNIAFLSPRQLRRWTPLSARSPAVGD